MGKPSPLAPKIRASILKGTPVAKIALQYNVSPAYVYKLRRDMLAQPMPPTLKTRSKKPAASPAPVPVPVPEPLMEPVVINNEPPPPKPMWRRVVDFLRGAR